MKRTPLKRKTPLKTNKGFKVSKKKTKKKVIRTKRAKKLEAKKKLCEQYDLPQIKCTRWGTAKTFTRTDLLKGMLWTVFSAFIRERDAGEPCITCQVYSEHKQAGHFMPVGGGDLELTFNEENVNGECPTCNADYQGVHLVFMRPNMVQKYGEEKVAEMEKNWKAKRNIKWDEEDFVERIKKYI